MNAVNPKNRDLPYADNIRERKLAAVKEYAGLVKRIAGRYSMRLPPDIEVDDLIQVGMIGLLESVDRYNPDKEASFKTFAEYRIRGAMLDELRSRDWIPRSVRSNLSRLDKTFLSLRKKGIYNPDHSQLAAEMEMDIDDFEDFLLKNISISLTSLETLGRSNYDGKMDILEALPNPEEKLVEEKMLSAEVKKLMAEAISKLTEREQLVLAMSFQEELNLKEISQVLDITEARVCQIRTRLIAYLHSFLTEVNIN